jgi:hypothetical protein
MDTLQLQHKLLLETNRDQVQLLCELRQEKSKSLRGGQGGQGANDQDSKNNSELSVTGKFF